MIPAGARCGLHGDVAAVDQCKRCGRFLCGECVQLVGEDAYCADCVGKLELPPSLMSSLTLVGGVTAWPLAATAFLNVRLALLSPMFAFTAAVLGFIELMLIAQGRSPRRGRQRAIVGLVAAILLAAPAAAWLLYVIFYLRP